MAAKKAKRSEAKVKAISLHIGLNAVSGAAYGRWTGPLSACEFDTNDGGRRESEGHASTMLLTKKSARANVLTGMRGAAKALSSGDLFLSNLLGPWRARARYQRRRSSTRKTKAGDTRRFCLIGYERV